MRKVFLLACQCLFVCLSTAYSQKLPNTLLWRIDGNGLERPSYLYGTMHLTDDRVFNLGDSLYEAIENSEGFAIEVNPEEMTTYLIDEISQQIKNAVLIKSVLSRKKFDEYAPALSKKLKKPADKITTKDIFTEKNKWVRESFQDGKMGTFLDAYLFDVARRLGKWTGGVEDIDDQKGLADDLVDESDIRQIATDDKANLTGEADKFVKFYVSGNLNAIDSISNTSDSAYQDALLIKRNLKMSGRIDSMDRIRSMVFAIGAAHLPGKKGLISLLQNKGYTITPVFSVKKIRPENYKVKEVALPWVSVNDPDSLYKVDMPGKPGNIELYGVLTMKMYFNIFNSTAYMVTAAATPYGKKGIDSIMNLYAADLFKQKNPKNIKTISINGINGREMESTDADGYKHGYILSKDNIIYIVLGMAVKQSPETKNIVNKFLSSYHPFMKKANGAISSYSYTDPSHRYSVDLPSKPQSGNEMIAAQAEKSIKSDLLISTDNQTGAYLFIGINKTTAGYFIENDSTSLRLIQNNTKVKFKSLNTDTLYTEGEKRILDMEGVMTQANFYGKAHFELIGNHWFGLIALYDTSKFNPSVEQFFRSFKLLVPAEMLWEQHTSPDGLVTAWVPDVITYHDDDSTTTFDFKKYQSYDSVQGNSYEIIASKFGKYYWQNSDSALWNSIRNNYSNGGDSILSQREVTNGSARGVEFQIRKNGSFNIGRKRILLYGDTLYTLISVQPRQNINNANTNKFFDEFSFNIPAPSSTIFTSKAAKLLQDISDKDSAISAEAKNSIRGANFSAKDIPLLYEAMLKTYPEPIYSYRSVNEDLKDVIIKLEDTSLPAIAKEKYRLVSSGQLKSLLLDIISGYKTKENYEDMRQMLIGSPPDTGLSYTFIANVKDSLALAANLLGGILPLIKDTIMAPAIINISSALLDSNVIAVSALQPYIKDILSFADSEYKKQKSLEDDYNYGDRFLIKLLGKLNTAETNAMLQKWLSIGSDYLKIICIESLLQNAQPVAAPVMLKIAATKSSRINLYNSLKKYNKQSLFPKQYLTQQYFGESAVYSVASDDSEPGAITFLTQKNFTFQGKQARFFFYQVTIGEDDDKTSYLACAGPYDSNPSNMCADDAYGSIYYEEAFDKTKLQQQMKVLIKQAEEED